MPKISEAKRIERKQLILEKALEVFSEKGYCSTSIDDIGKKANISKGLIYTYFKSKEELFLEIAENWNRMQQQGNVPDNDIKNSDGLKISDKLIILWDEIVNQWTSENLMFARILYEFWFESSKIPELQQIMMKRSQASLGLVEKIILESNPTIDPAMSTAFSRLWWAQIDGLVVYFVNHGKVPDEGEMSRIRSIIKHMSEFFDK
ncbi:TetR/AcrR family transcriptional regulator [Priestia taiwanensis]|uniref:HTH tetR-type domain-containing protein n=1 Tax=Priestia taiwanensis TaxID=1347902 RepID=A0A917ERB1_9BACI|nr:TetR/AcrR family transcriptional regulator [Priestia taiwanensis]MBM7363861.1 AcrR family transcriptional regulator [Priestia taiwanensis]GGE69584.1 hypothetical protein GCM10007140_19540 [Priestia taiwanensis]